MGGSGSEAEVRDQEGRRGGWRSGSDGSSFPLAEGPSREEGRWRVLTFRRREGDGLGQPVKNRTNGLVSETSDGRDLKRWRGRSDCQGGTGFCWNRTGRGHAKEAAGSEVVLLGTGLRTARSRWGGEEGRARDPRSVHGAWRQQSRWWPQSCEWQPSGCGKPGGTHRVLGPT